MYDLGVFLVAGYGLCVAGCMYQCMIYSLVKTGYKNKDTP